MRWAVGKLWSKLFFVDTWLFRVFLKKKSTMIVVNSHTESEFLISQVTPCCSYQFLLAKPNSSISKIISSHTQTRRHGNFSSLNAYWSCTSTNLSCREPNICSNTRMECCLKMPTDLSQQQAEERYQKFSINLFCLLSLFFAPSMSSRVSFNVSGLVEIWRGRTADLIELAKRHGPHT